MRVCFKILVILLISSCSRFEKVNEALLKHNITRTAFYSNDNIYFSTLESYHTNILKKDKLICVKHEIKKRKNSIDKIFGSCEGRNYVSNSNYHFISTSLNPKILKLNTKNDNYEIIFEGESYGMWIHQLAIKGDHIYFTYSYPQKQIDELQHIFKLNHKTKSLDKIPFKTSINQSYSGVESVDPDGNVWFWQGYPTSFYWLKSGVLKKREIIINNKKYLVSSWDFYNNKLVYNIFDEFNNLFKLEKETKKIINKELPFSNLIRLDYHNSKNNFADFYININNNFIYKRIDDSFIELGAFNMGELKLIYNQSSKNFQDSVISFKNNILGELQIININEKEIIFWLTGEKSYGKYDINNGNYILNKIDVENVTPSNITSLVSDFEGKVYGGGYLTSSDMFSYNPENGITKRLPNAVKYSLGQINSLYLGRDSMIYGSTYPHAKLFFYNPKNEWNPGFDSVSNPISFNNLLLGKNQMRSFKTILDHSNNLFVESVSDYSFPKIHSLNKYNFVKRKLVSVNNIDNDFPIISDLTPYDFENNLLIGFKNDKKYIYKISNIDFSIVDKINISNTKSFLINSNDDVHKKEIFLVNDNKLYFLNENFKNIKKFEFEFEILKSVKGENGKEIFFFSKYVIYKYDIQQNKMRRYLSLSFSRLNGFREDDWLAIDYNNKNKLIYFAYLDELWSFNPN